MTKLLEQLRQKPDLQKKTISFAIAALLAGILLVTWVSTFSFSGASTATESVLHEPKIEQPLSALKMQLGNLREAFTSQQPIEQ